jgi:hypothetical protein
VLASLIPSKFAVDPLLFKPEPPTTPRQVKQLFCGRRASFLRGLEGLKAGLDINGKRGTNSAKYPWVIHGESRSGKSHLARRIFAELPDTDQRFQFRVFAGGRLEAIAVMRDLFEQFKGRFLNRLLAVHGGPIDPLMIPEVQVAKQLVEKIGLFEAGTQSATLTYEEAHRKARELGGELGTTLAPGMFGAVLGKFIAKFQTERSDKTAVQLALRTPTAADLADVCGIMAETLLRHGLVRHVLVLMDDVDLLESYVSPQQNAKHQRSLLGQAVQTLHSVPGVDVVLTARSWFVHSDDKNLHTLVDLSQEPPMTGQEMLEIHDLRLKAFGKKQPVAAFLTRDALGELAGDVDGLPGVFLQHMQTAFYQYLSEDDTTPREYSWLLARIRRHLDTFKDKCTPGYEAIRNAVNSGTLSVNVASHNPFYGTMLHNEYAYQSYFSETTYFIPSVVRKVLSST